MATLRRGTCRISLAAPVGLGMPASKTSPGERRRGLRIGRGPAGLFLTATACLMLPCHSRTALPSEPRSPPSNMANSLLVGRMWPEACLGETRNCSRARARSSASGCAGLLFLSEVWRRVFLEVVAEPTSGRTVDEPPSSPDERGSSLAVVKESDCESVAATLDKPRSTCEGRRARLRDAGPGGVTSGVGGLRWSGGVAMDRFIA